MGHPDTSIPISILFRVCCLVLFLLLVIDCWTPLWLLVVNLVRNSVRRVLVNPGEQNKPRKQLFLSCLEVVRAWTNESMQWLNNTSQEGGCEDKGGNWTSSGDSSVEGLPKSEQNRNNCCWWGALVFYVCWRERNFWNYFFFMLGGNSQWFAESCITSFFT